MKKLSITSLIVSLVTLSSCSPDPHVNAAQTRGAVGGAALGAIVGKNTNGIGQGEAMAAGAVIGALSAENQLRRTNRSVYGR